MQLILPHPSIVNKPWCVCTHPIDPMGIHLLHCAHGNEHIGTHDVIRNIFAAIVWNVGFHVGRQQLHAFFSTTFNSFHRWIDIMLIKYGICTLANVVITDPTWIDLLPQSSLVEIYDFATNEFATSCDYLTFTTTVGYIYNYYLHLKPLATTLWLTYD